MAGKTIDETAYVNVLNALKQYNDQLNASIVTMKQAAQACLDTMGNDEFSTRYVGKLNASISEYSKVSKLIEESYNNILKELKVIREM